MSSPAFVPTGDLKIQLIAKLARVMPLSSEERIYLRTMQGDFRQGRAGHDIITAGHVYRGIFILGDGIAMRYKILRDGRRQVLGVSLPGDFIGFPGCLFETALYSAACVTDTMVCALSFEAVFELFRRHPRVGAAIFWLVGHEAALFAEHLVSLGRQSAYERVAYLVLELLVRLQAVGIADARSYEMPLTQEVMADALGLSAQHVNRILRRLRDDGLIAIVDERVVCRDIEALARVSEFDRAGHARRRIPGLSQLGTPPERHADRGP